MAGQNAPRALAPSERSESRGEVTFARDVAPILFANCAYCHRPGEVAPFSLLSYTDARPWAVSIKRAVSTRQMPPWNADPHYGSFRDPRRLTDAEIATIVAWVDGGSEGRQPVRHAGAAAVFRRLADRRAGPRADDGGAGEDPGERDDSVSHRSHELRVPRGHLDSGDRSPSGQSPRRASRGRVGIAAGRQRSRAAA